MRVSVSERGRMGESDSARVSECGCERVSVSVNVSASEE